MSLLLKAIGITKLSELQIDVDKDWQTKGITNIKQVAALMSKGDIVVRGDSILQKLSTGPEGYVLTSEGSGKIPTWAPAGGALKYYFPVEMFSSNSKAIVAVSKIIGKSGLATTSHVQVYVDDVPNMVKRFTPSPTVSKSAVIISVDQMVNKSAPIGTDIAILVDGAVSETAAAVQTNETTAARNATSNDMNLCPMTGALGDKYYLGLNLPFRRVYVNVSTAGAGNWANQVYYWNGAWVLVSNEEDQTGQFMVAATRRINWDMPGDWVKNTIMGMDLYWIKIETTTFVNQTTKPLGAQAWACPVA